MKNLYNKIAPVFSKIFLAGLILSVLAHFGGKYYVNSLQPEQEWEIYYGTLTVVYSTYVIIACAVLYVLFAFTRLWPAVKEAVRKFIVSLKRNPSTIPLVMMFVTFLYYSLNLTDVSDTTAKIYGKGMGLCEFCIMLFSLLSLVCMLNAFPRRKKPNIPMIVIMFAMYAVIIYCDIHYCNMINVGLARGGIAITTETMYIPKAYNMLNVHMVMTIVSAALVVLLPVYSKLLRMIKTSVAVEDNGDMGTIEIED